MASWFLPEGKVVVQEDYGKDKTGDNYKLIIAASRSRGGDIYLDKQILDLVEKNNFEKVSDKMVAVLPPQRREGIPT